MLGKSHESQSASSLNASLKPAALPTHFPECAHSKSSKFSTQIQLLTAQNIFRTCLRLDAFMQIKISSMRHASKQQPQTLIKCIYLARTHLINTSSVCVWCGCARKINVNTLTEQGRRRRAVHNLIIVSCQRINTRRLSSVRLFHYNRRCIGKRQKTALDVSMSATQRGLIQLLPSQLTPGCLCITILT